MFAVDLGSVPAQVIFDRAYFPPGNFASHHAVIQIESPVPLRVVGKSDHKNISFCTAVRHVFSPFWRLIIRFLKTFSLIYIKRKKEMISAIFFAIFFNRRFWRTPEREL